jgi:hypothetical protein
MDKEGSKMSDSATASDQPGNQPARRRGPGRPFPKGVSQTSLFAATRAQMLDEVIADLEEAGRKVTSADRLLAQRYVELLRSRDHSDTNTALKIRQALVDKYARNRPGMTLERYAALQANKDAAE